MQLLDLTGLNPLSFFFYRPQYIEEFILRENGSALEGLALLKGTYRVDLSGCKTRNLLPLSECRDAMTIDLTGADLSLETLDEYLIDLVKHHYGRRNARLILSLQPSGEYQEPLRDENLDYNITTGMEAVWLLLNEPSWNEGGLWQFDIDGTIYKASTPENQPPSNKEPEPDIEDDYDLDFTDPEIP